jgi:hypothetical protein
MFVTAPATSTWFEARCAQDVDAMLKRLEQLGPNLKDVVQKREKHSDDQTYDTEASTIINESVEYSDEDAPVSDVSSDGEDEHRHHQNAETMDTSDRHLEDFDFVDGHEKKTVHVVGLRGEDALPSKIELQNCTNDELLELLEQMRERLTQSLQDVAGEKFIRRKKEKTLEKLAKELCKRVCEGDMKEKQIRDVSSSSCEADE